MTIDGTIERVSDLDAEGHISTHLVEGYRRDSFVRVRGILEPAEVDRFHVAAERFLEANRANSLAKDGVFTQLVNVWTQDDSMRELTLHRRVAAVAEQLAGIPLRIWHDHMLVKEPHNEAPTEFHQDRPKWPHTGDRHSLSAWIALVDVPVERGCMTFLPDSQTLTDLRDQNLRDADDLFRVAPALRWNERRTIPLRAGDCTFHNSYTAHMATPNHTDQPRLAHVVIYMDADTAYSGRSHPVTNDLGLVEGDRLDGDLFPRPWSS